MHRYGGCMANTTLVQLKVDSEIKENVSRIYENLGLDLPTAIRIFFKKSGIVNSSAVPKYPKCI